VASSGLPLIILSPVPRARSGSTQEGLALAKDGENALGPASWARPTTDDVSAEGPLDSRKHEAMAGIAALVKPRSRLCDVRKRSICAFADQMQLVHFEKL
jgi:hypothetical protein